LKERELRLKEKRMMKLGQRVKKGLRVKKLKEKKEVIKRTIAFQICS
jgi:archaellum biogenesis ATPase FlaH